MIGQSDPKDSWATTFDIELLLRTFNQPASSFSFNVIVKYAELRLDLAWVIGDLRDSVNLVTRFEALCLVLSFLVAAEFQAADVGCGCATGVMKVNSTFLYASES